MARTGVPNATSNLLQFSPLVYVAPTLQPERHRLALTKTDVQRDLKGQQHLF